MDVPLNLICTSSCAPSFYPFPCTLTLSLDYYGLYTFHQQKAPKLSLKTHLHLKRACTRGCVDEQVPLLGGGAFVSR